MKPSSIGGPGARSSPAEREREHERDHSPAPTASPRRVKCRALPRSDTSEVGQRREGRSRYCERKWSLLRAAIAMIVPCGLTPGASGSSDASFTRRFVKPHTRPKLSAPVRSRFSPMRTVDVRCTVIRLARLRESRVPPLHEVVGAARDDAAGHRRVHLGGARREQHLAEVQERAGEPAHVAVGQVVGDERRAEARQREHAPVALAADRGVVDGDVLPVGERVGVVGAGVGERERDVAAPAGRSADREPGRELGDAVHRHVAVVDRVIEACRDLHRRVHLQAVADVAADAAALQQRGRLGRARAHEHVVGADRRVARSCRRASVARTARRRCGRRWRTSSATRQSAMTRAPASIARGSSVRAIVCFTARPLGS